MDIGDICDVCVDMQDGGCATCPYGNPCLGCIDYDGVRNICKSNGGCASGISSLTTTQTVEE